MNFVDRTRQEVKNEYDATGFLVEEAVNHEILKSVIFDQHEIIKNIDIVPRDYEFDKNANYVLTGLRRAGKSTMLYKKCRDLVDAGTNWNDIIYINFEDERLIEFNADDFNDIIAVHSEIGDGNGYYFFDEIQNIQGWEKFARRMADMKEHICITGSNATMLSREIETTLGGRFITKHITPYSFPEYLRATGTPWNTAGNLSTKAAGLIMKQFEKYLAFGGFPELLQYEIKREYIMSVYQKVLLGDIITRNKIRNDYAARILFKKIAESVCSEISYSKMHNLLNTVGISVSKDSVIEYVNYAINAYLLFPVQNYFTKFAEREGSQKYYFSDNGILNLFLRDGNSALLENVVATDLLRKYGEIFFLKSAKTGIDIDFYVPETKTAVQVAYSIKTSAREREISNLKKLASSFKEAERFVVLTKDEHEIIEENGIKIEVIPVFRFLLGI